MYILTSPPILLYGCEIWKMNLGDDKLVDLFHNKLKDRQDSMAKPRENGTAPACICTIL